MLRAALIISLLFWLSATNGLAQGDNYRSDNLDKAAYGCELVARELDDLVMHASKNENADQVIILVARLGKNEQATELNHWRLQAVADYLSGSLPTTKLVLTTGERVKDHDELKTNSADLISAGRVEIYFQGKLWLMILAANNTDLCVNCCDQNPKKYQSRSHHHRPAKRVLGV